LSHADTVAAFVAVLARNVQQPRTASPDEIASTLWNTRATEDALRKQLAEAVGIIRRYSIKDAEDFLARVGEGK
jgi:hypothetical protein